MSAAEAVANGAQLLDERYPGWYRKIDREALVINSRNSCICGQLAPYVGGTCFSEFLDAKLDAPDHAEDHNAYAAFVHDHGFSSWHGGPRTVENEWKKAIRARLDMDALPEPTTEKETVLS